MERPVAYMGVNEDLWGSLSTGVDKLPQRSLSLCRDEREYQKSGVNIVNVNHSISLSVPC